MSGFTPFNRVKACRHGTMVYNRHDIYVGRSLDCYGEFSEGEASLFEKLLQPGMVAVEVGANIGAHTIVLAQAVWPGGGVLAFEPQRLAFQTLCANLALNHITNVEARKQAVGATAGALFVPDVVPHEDNNFGGLALGDFQSGDRVPLVTVDGLQLVRCDLLKVDVEGMELAVVEGAAATIARCRPVLYVENDRPKKSACLVRRIACLGYRMYWHVVPLFNPDNFAGNSENVFGQYGSFNMICSPEGVNCPLDDLPPVVVPDQK